mgnify:CR=1 FL=1
MMLKIIIKYKIFFFLFFIILLLFYYLNRFNLKLRAESSSVDISFNPGNFNIKVGEVSPEISIFLNFVGFNNYEKIDYIKLMINFPKENLELFDYINTLESGLNRQMRVDGPFISNSSGIIIIELGASSLNSGPSVNKPVLLAKMRFKGKSSISQGKVTIGNVQIINSFNSNINVRNKNILYFSVIK